MRWKEPKDYKWILMLIAVASIVFLGPQVIRKCKYLVKTELGLASSAQKMDTPIPSSS